MLAGMDVPTDVPMDVPMEQKFPLNIRFKDGQTQKFPLNRRFKDLKLSQGCSSGMLSRVPTAQRPQTFKLAERI